MEKIFLTNGSKELAALILRKELMGMKTILQGNKKVLITGGLGFIGSNLAISLVKLGAEVTLMDAMIPEYGANLYLI